MKSIDEIKIGSIWMAADGGSYGYIVADLNHASQDVLCRGFSDQGWYDEDYLDIDVFKLQYRYYLVKE